MSERTLTVVRWSIVFFSTVGLCGCLLRPDVDPKALPENPNGFTVGSGLLGGKVHTVEVWQSHEGGSTLIWRIKSKDGVSAKGFSVTVGRVPSGFVQTIPSEGEAIHLTKGEIYRIVMLTNNWPEDVDPSGTAWVAE